jgi:single-stranded-DNA-specific exonuclease
VRGQGIAGLLGDLVAAGEPVLAVAAHAGHRAAALRDRVGGFALTTWSALEADPGLAARATHVVAIDPPAHAHLRALAEQLPGDGWTHLAWGGAEEEVARRVLTWELDLRPHLTEVYRALRAAAAAPAEGAVPANGAPADGVVAGTELLAHLRGRGPQPRTGALAGRLLRVLDELGLIALDRTELAVRVPPPAGRTELEESPAYRAYAQRLADGLAHLAPAAPQPQREPAALAA